MSSAIVVHQSFDAIWPFAADHWHKRWQQQGDVHFVRDRRLGAVSLSDLLTGQQSIRRLAALGVAVTAEDLVALPDLRELVCDAAAEPPGLDAACASRQVRRIRQQSEGFWGQSVAEFALGLTLCGLRRIPQLYRQMVDDLSVWDYSPPGGVGTPQSRGQQFGDDALFTAGTIAGKRVRIVGAGNIGSRYAKWCAQIGADVAVWDPFATEPCFHLAQARRELHLDRLVADAEIFAPMVPLRDSTRNLVHADLIRRLPRGCLVVLVTRAQVCDMATLLERVLADEFALAADVFEIEPLIPGHPLLGRRNVVHTPHHAGRTKDANIAWAEALLSQFAPN